MARLRLSEDVSQPPTRDSLNSTMLKPRSSRGCRLLLSVVGLSFVGYVLFVSVRIIDVLGMQKAPISIAPPCVPHYETTSGDQEDWHFSSKLHSQDYGLSDWQCQAAFPDLYQDIDRAVAKAQRRPITQKDLDGNEESHGSVRAMLYQGRLYILNQTVYSVSHTHRGYAALLGLHRAITASTSLNDLSPVEFDMTFSDYTPEWQYTWSFTRHAPETDKTNIWLMPDFGFYSWPEPRVLGYADLMGRIDEVEQSFTHFSQKQKKLIWRGARHMAPELRGKFIDISDGKSWSDVQALKWGVESSVRDSLVTMEDHCSYAWTAYLEGRSYSGALKYLLNCKSVLVAHEMDWVQSFSHLMIPEGEKQNYVSAKRDWSDLDDKMRQLERSDEFGERIVTQASRVFKDRYMTPAAEACYWRRLIRSWASVSFTPETHELDPRGRRKVRGVDFESYIIMQKIDWAPQ